MVSSKIKPVFKKAEEDITVYKTVRDCSCPLMENTYLDTLSHTFFTLNEPNSKRELVVEYEDGHSRFLIKNGYESAKELEDLEELGIKLYHPFVIVEFIIPKGSLYFENEVGDMVSDTIIIKKQL